MTVITKELFGTVDYIVFFGVLVASAAIGVWFAYKDRKNDNTQEFLLGGRSLSIFPVAMSILSSFISAIFLLGTPSEVYRYGTQIMIKMLAMCFMIPTAAYLYLPVYYNLRLTSAYEYLERRFHRVIRLMGSFVFMLHMVIYMSVVMYAPALALSEVTGIGLSTTILSIGLVCTFYTSIGGIKAVVWTDLFQTVVMYAAMGVVIIKGISDLGGLNVIWERSLEGNRIEFFRFDFDPTIRHTFWSLFIGGYVTWLSTFAANQAMIQRYLSVGTLQGSQRCLWINIPALVILSVMTCLAGLMVFAYYWKCDPIGAKIISKPDQVFPRFVMETLGSFPGLPGLFVSGVFSGSLSTVSSGVNSLAAVALEDFVKGTFFVELSEVWATRLSKILAVVFGLISISLVLVAKTLGGVLQVAATIHGIVGGPMLGLFTLGLFFPNANTWGASLGLLCGFASSTWFGVGAFVNKPFSPEAPMSYENCTDLFYNATNVNLTGINVISLDIGTKNEHIFYPYKLSYMWLSLISFVVVLVVGNCVSLLTGARDDVDRELLSPLTNWYNEFTSTSCERLASPTKEKEPTPPTVLSLTPMDSRKRFV